MERGCLIVQHDVICSRDAHDESYSCIGKQRHQNVHIILICLSMVGVTHIATQWDAKQLSTEMILKSCPDNLFSIE
jgi:hypothetical protein